MSPDLQLTPAPPLPPGSDWPPAILGLECQLTLEIAVPGFTVGDLLRLNRGSLIDACAKQSTDVPLRANGVAVGLAELDVVNGCLAARITELL